jgi:hypothetical protein
MNTIVRSKRILEALKAFRPMLGGMMPDYLRDSGFENARIIGVYENVVDSIDHCVVIAEDGIHVEEQGEWIDIRFAEIRNVHCPSEKEIERKAAEVNLVLENGRNTTVPVWGGSGRFLDVFEFSRFLSRVVEDVGENKS